MNDVYWFSRASTATCASTLSVTALLMLAAAAPVNAQTEVCVQTRGIADLVDKGDSAGAAILLDANCAKALAENGRREDATIILDAGYPSALVGHFEDEDLMLALEQQVDQGDHGFFDTDPALAPLLLAFANESPHLAEQAMKVRDFSLASRAALAELGGSEVPLDEKRYAMFLPIWQDEAARTEFLRICGKASCGEPPASFDACDINAMEANKLAFARDPHAFMQDAEICDVSHMNVQYVLALRQYGLIDASCSPTLQVNAMVAVGLRAAASCTDLLMSIGGQSSFSSADVVRYYRRIESGKFMLTAEVAEKNAEAVALQSPAVAERLRSMLR